MLDIKFTIDREECGKLIPDPKLIDSCWYPYGVLRYGAGSPIAVLENPDEQGTKRYAILIQASSTTMRLPSPVLRAVEEAEKKRSKPVRSPGRPKVLPPCHRLNLELPVDMLNQMSPPYTQWIRKAIQMRLDTEDKVVKSLL